LLASAPRSLVLSLPCGYGAFSDGGSSRSRKTSRRDASCECAACRVRSGDRDDDDDGSRGSRSLSGCGAERTDVCLELEQLRGVCRWNGRVEPGWDAGS
jgi:hypothetical protein